MSKWNNDENSERMFRVQNKGSRLVLESKERYNELMLKYLEDKSIFKEDQEDQSQINIENVHKWVRKMGKKRTAREQKRWNGVQM